MMAFIPPSLKNTIIKEYPENSEDDNPSTLNKHPDELTHYPTRITFRSPSELAILSCPPSPRSRSRPKKKEWPNLIQVLDIFPTPPSTTITKQKTRKGNWSSKAVLGQNQNQTHTEEKIGRNDDRKERQPHPRQRYTATCSSKYCHNQSKISRRNYDVKESLLKNTDDNSNVIDSSGKSMDVRTDRQFKFESSQEHDIESENFQAAQNGGSINSNEDVSDFLRMELLASVLTRISQPNQNESNSNPTEVDETNTILPNEIPSLPNGPVAGNKKPNRDRFNQCRKCLKYEKLLKKADSRIKHFENLKIFFNKEMEILREDLSKAKAKIAEQSVEGSSWIPLTEENVENTTVTQFSSARKWNPNVDYFSCRTFDTELDAHLQLGFPHKIYSAEIHTSKRRHRHRQKIEEIRKKFKHKQNNGDNKPVKVPEQEKLIGFIGSNEFMSTNKPIPKFRICLGTVGIRSRSTPSDSSKRYNLKKKTYLEIHQRRMNRNINQHDTPPQQLIMGQNNPKSSESMRKRTQSLPRNSKVSISSNRTRNSNSSNVEILAVACASREGLIREIANSIAKAKRILHFRFDMLIASDFRMEDFHFLLTSHRRFIRWLHNYVNYSRSLMRKFDEKHLKPGTTKLFVPAVIRLNQNKTYKGIFIPIPQTLSKTNGTELDNDDKMYLEKPIIDASTQEAQMIQQSMKTTTISLATQSTPKTLDFQQNFNGDCTLKIRDEALPIYQSAENSDDTHSNDEIHNEFSFTSTRNLMSKTTQNLECGDENYKASIIGTNQIDNNNNNTICAIANLTVDSLRNAINDMDSTETFRNVLLNFPKHRNVALQSIGNSTVAANFNYVQQLSPCSKNCPMSTSSNSNSDNNNDSDNHDKASDLNVNPEKYQTQSESDCQLLKHTNSHLNTSVKAEYFEENFSNLKEKKSSIIIEITDQNQNSFQEKCVTSTKSKHGDQFPNIDDDDNSNYDSFYYDPIITEDHNHVEINGTYQDETIHENEEEPEDKIHLPESEYDCNSTYDDEDEVSSIHSPCYQPIMSDSNTAQSCVPKHNEVSVIANSNINKNKDTEKLSISHELFSPLDLIQKHHFDTAQKFYCHQGNFHMRALDPNNFISSNNHVEDPFLTNPHYQQQKQKKHLIQHFILKATSLNEPKISSPPVLLQLSTKSGERKNVLDFSQMEKYFEDNVKKYKETLITEKIQNKSPMQRFPSAVQFVQGILNESKENKSNKKQEQKKDHEQEQDKNLDGDQQLSDLSLGNCDYKGGSVYIPEIEKEEENQKELLVVIEEKEKLVKPNKSKLNFIRPSLFSSSSSSLAMNSKPKEHDKNLNKPVLTPQPACNNKNSKQILSPVPKSKPSFIFQNWKNRKISQEQVESKIAMTSTNKISRDANQPKIPTDQKESGGEKAKSFIQNSSSNGSQIMPKIIQSRLPVPKSPTIIPIKPNTIPTGISEISVPRALKCSSIISNVLADTEKIDRKEKEKDDDKKEKPKRPSYIPVKTKTFPNTIHDTNRIDNNLNNASRPKILPQTSIKRRERSLIPITTTLSTSRAKTSEGNTNGRDKMEKSLSFSNSIQSCDPHSKSVNQSRFDRPQRTLEILSEKKREKSPKKMWSKAMERTRLWSFTKKPNTNKN